jgi:mannose-1-phosphate guanylyltransferase
MVGGSGTRFWPLSRRQSPKYLLPIVGEKSMLEQTVDRIEPSVGAERIWCITSEGQAPGIRRALPDLPEENIIGEPMPRDSAACVALAAVTVQQADPDAVMLCMPGDNLVQQADRFRRTVDVGARVAEEGKLVTFGVKPAAPETRFGYIHRGERLTDFKEANVYEVQRFTEKPDAPTARQMVDSGEYYWNSGNFIWRADVILEQFRRHAPRIHEAVERIRPALGTGRAADVIREEYEKLEKVSIDYAVMEKAEDVATVEADFDWDDVGSWTALERHADRDEAGNTKTHLSLVVDSEGCILSGRPGHLIAALGLKDFIVVQTDDATLVCPKDRANDVKGLVQELEKQGLDDYL